jgi:hypothetical protein
LLSDHYAHHVQDWDATIAGYVHRPLDVEDELPVNPYIDACPEVPKAVIYLREREAKSTSGRKPRLGHYEIVQVAMRFYVQFRACDLVILSMSPAIAWEVSRVLRVTTQADATVPLRHGEFCEYRVHMEWYQGKMFFMRGWEVIRLQRIYNF